MKLSDKVFEVASEFVKDCMTEPEVWSEEWLISVTLGLMEIGDSCMTVAKEAVPDMKNVACKKGCSFCSYIPVVVTVGELAVLNTYLSQEMSVARQKEIRDFNELAVIARAKFAGPRVEMGLRCSFLEEDICSVYEARPSACRGYNSMSLSDCQNGWKKVAHVTSLSSQIEIYTAIATPLAMRLRQKYGVGVVEMESGLRKCFEDPHAIAKYLAGEKVFETPDLPVPNVGSQIPMDEYFNSLITKDQK